MLSFRVAAPVAALTALGLVGVPALVDARSGPAPAVAEASDAADHAPVAYGSGGDAVALVYPSILNVRLTRAEAALERLATSVDEGNAAAAQKELTASVSNMKKAWSAAAYIILTTPPPVAGDDAVMYTAGGPPNAVPEQGAYAVLSLQHDFITTAVGLLNGPTTGMIAPLRAAIEDTFKSRSGEINHIKSIAPPPVATDDAVDDAHANGTPIAVGWDTLMPDVGAMLTDENQMLTGTKAPDAATTTSFRQWKARNTVSFATINTAWPPVPADD